MRLYQHSAHCSVAVQLFLEHNPVYWYFIPRPRKEVEQENDFYARIVLATGLLTGISFPPAERHFSSAQIQKQRLFFDRLLLSLVDQLPYVETDLYKMKIIAVCK
ncbi:unnamed protein product [Rotaria magnacalcarata]|nr:unnamed protein product [Rotaria magnacalcarata]CAF4239217.1 unnamed protein product [Rotaria magnacalcarata]CAF4351497.1 unnamed protein product [Rotaria magnacalcarata]